MPTRLSGIDALWLYVETATAHMHVGSVLVVDPSTASEPLTHERVLRYVEDRLHLAPVFRRRVAPVPFRIDHPVWIEDPDFDLEFHVRRAALPAPGGRKELAAFAADVMGRRLDRSRPLWELHVVEGLEDGRMAFVSKTHHAAVDGVSGADLLAAMLQLEPDQAPPPPPDQPWKPDAEPGDLRLLLSSGLRLVMTPLGMMKVARRTTRATAGMLRMRRSSDQTPPAPFAAPATPLNGAIGPHRVIALADQSLESVKAVKRVFGGTVNDVILAAVASGLRRYLLGRGERMDRPLVGMVPISVRSEDQRGQQGNQVSMMLVDLPADEPDPVQRLRRVTRGTAGAKEQHGALGAHTLQELAELTPAGLSSLAARLYTRSSGADRHRPIWNVVVSNVPGPRIPLYYAGAKVEAMYPIGPVHEMCGLNVTLFSYQDMISIGLNADRSLVPDVEEIAVGICAAIDDLAKLAADSAAGGRD